MSDLTSSQASEVKSRTSQRPSDKHQKLPRLNGDSAKVIERKNFILEALGRMVPDVEIVALFKEKFKLCERQAYRYLRVCRAEVMAYSKQTREQSMAESLHTCNLVIRRTMGTGKYQTAIKAVEHRDKLKGLVQSGSLGPVIIPGGTPREMSTEDLVKLAQEMGIKLPFKPEK